MSSTRIPKGQGRVEFLAHKPEIQALKAKGYTAKRTYGELKAKGKITLSYLQFWKYWKGMNDTPPAPVEVLPSALPEDSLPALPAKQEKISDKKPKKREREKKRTPPAPLAALPLNGDMTKFAPQNFSILEDD